MKTDVIAVSGSERDLAATLRQAEKMAVYEELAPKNAIQLRLLTEEMMQMMRSITGAMEGDFWIENEGNDYQLHLSVNTRLTSGKRAQFSSTMLNQGFAERAGGTPMDWEWSMVQYQNALNASVQNDVEGAQEAWDEMEKSVVAHAADDVKVSLRGNLVEMIIYKKMA